MSSLQELNQMRRTPEWVGVSTGNTAIDKAFAISVDLVEDLTRQYHEQKGQKGWLPVSGGVRGHMTSRFDTRDSAHAVKMAAYLWGSETDLGATLENSMFIEYINPETGALAHPFSTFTRNKAIGVAAGMYLRCVSDTFRYFAPAGNFNEAMRRAALTADWMVATFDPERSGLLDCRNEHGKCFWGAHLGEANHFPPNFDPKSKTVVATMAFCVWLRRMTEAARSKNHPATGHFEKLLKLYSSTIEEKAWSDRGGYYHCQFDRISDKWFFSMNGLSEKSRETDIIPYYCAESDIDMEHKRCVARHLDNALTHDRIFPMPIYYPNYAWYSPQHPNFTDHGVDKFIMGGSWDTPYFHCVQLLSQMGLAEALELAVRKRAEAIARDGDCTEWYHLDGTIDHQTGYHRDRYLVSATAQIAATIEGLFGITPAEPGFSVINFAPLLPLFRRHRHTGPLTEANQAPKTIRITLPEGRRLEFSISYNESEEKIKVKTNKLDAKGIFRIPIDYAGRVQNADWGGVPVQFTIVKLMGQSFITLEHVLDGKELVIGLAPHPQKGKGTTPFIEVSPTGEVTLKGCGSPTPSPAVF
ncbi:MAG: hypothetical protein WC637_22915 [Victivallales bacterium]|jgi:hypothetical protein